MHDYALAKARMHNARVAPRPTDVCVSCHIRRSEQHLAGYDCDDCRDGVKHTHPCRGDLDGIHTWSRPRPHVPTPPQPGDPW